VTGRALIVQGALAVGGLSVAYATWQREPERALGDVIVVDATKNELANVHFEDDNTSVDIHKGDRQSGRKDSDSDEGIWLHILEKTPTPKPPAHAQSVAVPPAPAKLKPPRDLRGDEPAAKLLDQFAPFRSPRGFGSLDAAKLKELGLDNAKKKLQVTARGRTHDFVIGAPEQGNGASYLRDTADNRVYLMPRSLLSDLQGAGYRLLDRKLHAFTIPDISRLVVTSGGKSRELLITNRQSATSYKLASPSAPEKPDELARNWHEKIWKLYPAELLGKGEQPAGGVPKVAARIEYFDGKKSMGWVEIAKLEVASKPVATAPSAADAKVASAAPATTTETYARSEHTAGWIKLTSDPSTLLDTEKVVSGS
jgi:hypothetical protein